MRVHVIVTSETLTRDYTGAHRRPHHFRPPPVLLLPPPHPHTLHTRQAAPRRWYRSDQEGRGEGRCHGEVGAEWMGQEARSEATPEGQSILPASDLFKGLSTVVLTICLPRPRPTSTVSRSSWPRSRAEISSVRRTSRRRRRQLELD